MHIYQFLAVVGRQGDQLLSNEAGEVTSHLQGMFYRTARMLEAGECCQLLLSQLWLSSSVHSSSALRKPLLTYSLHAR
jgi:hypothetical protein